MKKILEKKETIAGIAMILIDVFNLAEQFGIYFIAKENSLDESVQQLFFFILFGVGGATVIRPMLPWSKLQTVFSICIEIGELISYLVVLPRSKSLIAVATVFFVMEILLHFVLLWGAKSNGFKIEKKICIRDFCCCPIRVLMYGLIYSSPILFLFLDPNSKFRDTYYENLLILNVFFGVNYIDLMFSYICEEESDPSIDELIYCVWQYVILVIYNILAIIVLITTLVFAGQALNRHATGDEVLKQYDFGVYIYCLVNCGLLAYGQVRNGYKGCMRCLSNKK